MFGGVGHPCLHLARRRRRVAGGRSRTRTRLIDHRAQRVIDSDDGGGEGRTVGFDDSQIDDGSVGADRRGLTRGWIVGRVGWSADEVADRVCDGVLRNAGSTRNRKICLLYTSDAADE